MAGEPRRRPDPTPITATREELAERAANRGGTCVFGGTQSARLEWEEGGSREIERWGGAGYGLYRLISRTTRRAEPAT